MYESLDFSVFQLLLSRKRDSSLSLSPVWPAFITASFQGKDPPFARRCTNKTGQNLSQSLLTLTQIIRARKQYKQRRGKKKTNAEKLPDWLVDSQNKMGWKGMSEIRD